MDFLYVRKETKNITIKTFHELELVGIPELKCPKCNNYMDIGYTIASRGLIFRKRDEELKLIASDKLISNTANLGFGIK